MIYCGHLHLIRPAAIAGRKQFFRMPLCYRSLGKGTGHVQEKDLGIGLDRFVLYVTCCVMRGERNKNGGASFERAGNNPDGSEQL